MILKTDLKVVAADLRLQASLGRSFPCGHDALAAHADRLAKADVLASFDDPIVRAAFRMFDERATEYLAKMLSGELEITPARQSSAGESV